MIIVFPLAIEAAPIGYLARSFNSINDGRIREVHEAVGVMSLVDPRK